MGRLVIPVKHHKGTVRPVPVLDNRHNPAVSRYRTLLLAGRAAFVFITFFYVLSFALLLIGVGAFTSSGHF
jgi:hypothetical protein